MLATQTEITFSELGHMKADRIYLQERLDANVACVQAASDQYMKTIAIVIPDVYDVSQRVTRLEKAVHDKAG